jgi:hypothetical protein
MRGTGIGTSLLLIASGAILAFAVDYQITGIDINAVGWILILIGVVGMVLSFLMLGSMTGYDDVIPTRHADTTHAISSHDVVSTRPATPPHEHRHVETTDVVYEGNEGTRVEREARVRR